MIAWDCLTTTLRLVWRRLGLLLAANVLWIALSLPIFTWPAATAGLFYLISRVVKEELDFEPHSARANDFWEGVRQYGWRGTLLAWFATVWVANIYMSLFARLRLDIKRERVEIKQEEHVAERIADEDEGAGDRGRRTATH